MTFKSKLQELKNKLQNRLANNPFAKDEKAMFDGVGMLKGAIVAIVALVIIITLGTAILPGSVTTLSNTSAITGYTTWSAGTQSVWTSLAVFVVLIFLIILVAVLLGVLG